MIDLRRYVKHQASGDAASDSTVEAAVIPGSVDANDSAGVAHPMPRPPPPT
jgi:hypothetical protein